MAIRLRDRKLLWARSGNMCAFPGCRRALVVSAEDTGRTVVVSQECHIVGQLPTGPRGASPLTREERDSYPNLILLCLEHHKIVDDDPETWTVDQLLAMKSTHERWFDLIRSAQDRVTETRDLLYAQVIDQWISDAGIERWLPWTAPLLSPTPHVSVEAVDALDVVRHWLFTRPWPRTHPEIERAFENFRLVASDIVMVAKLGLERQEDELRLVPAFKKRWVDNYEELADQADWTVDLVHDLALELTRAANLVLDAIREGFDPLFRTEEGVLVVERIGAGLYTELIRPRYESVDFGEENEDDMYAGLPYRGLDHFLEARATRAIHYGVGRHENGYRAITPIRLND